MKKPGKYAHKNGKGTRIKVKINFNMHKNGKKMHKSKRKFNSHKNGKGDA